MLTTLASILLTITLLFGGAGATVYAAQDSLPDGFLYPVKTFSEDARLGFPERAQTRLQLVLAFANRRIKEANDMASQGQAVPQEVSLRLQQHLEYALQLAAGLDEGELKQALEQIQANLRTQERSMLQSGTPEDADPVMAQIRSMLREQLRLVDLCLDEPLLLRQHLQERLQDRQQEQQQDRLQDPLQDQLQNRQQEQQQQRLQDRTGASPEPPVPAGESNGPGPNAGPNASSSTGNSTGPGPSAGPTGGPGPNTGSGTGNGTGPGGSAGSGTGSSTGPGPNASSGPGPTAGPGPNNGSGTGSGAGSGSGGSSQTAPTPVPASGGSGGRGGRP